MLFRIQQRDFSSNIVERGILDENNNIKWIPYIAPLCNKKEGDIICENLYRILSFKLQYE